MSKTRRNLKADQTQTRNGERTETRLSHESRMKSKTKEAESKSEGQEKNIDKQMIGIRLSIV